MSKSKVTNGDRIKLALALVALITAIAMLVLWQTEAAAPPWYALVYCGALIVMSGVTFIAYWLDKRRARKDEWRISERKLHTMELLGGWPGAIFARQWLRHKTVKASYRLMFWLIVVAHLALIATAIMLAFKNSSQ